MLNKTNSPQEHKTCTKCGEDKPMAAFYNERLNRDGKMGKCKECTALKNKVWEKTHKAKSNAYSRAWHQRNVARENDRSRLWRSSHSEYFANYYQDNIDKEHIRGRKYRQTHLAQTAARQAKRKALLLGATPPGTNMDDIKAFYESAEQVSKCLGIPMHVDHIIPLSKGGTHEPSNLQVIPASENLAKSNIMPEVFYRV